MDLRSLLQLTSSLPQTPDPTLQSQANSISGPFDSNLSTQQTQANGLLALDGAQYIPDHFTQAYYQLLEYSNAHQEPSILANNGYSLSDQSQRFTEQDQSQLNSNTVLPDQIRSISQQAPNSGQENPYMLSTFDIVRRIVLSRLDDQSGRNLGYDGSFTNNSLIPQRHPLLAYIQRLALRLQPQPVSQTLPQILKILKILLASQAAIDLLSLAQYIKDSKPKAKRTKSDIKIPPNEGVVTKIRKAQEEMKRVLSEEPNSQKIVFRGKLRGEFKSDGSRFVGSEYRGVCKNGVQFQMFIMIDGKRKLYKGGFKTAKEAGIVYDRAAIQLRGLKARTNLSYTKAETLSILLGDDHVFDISRLPSQTH